MTVITRFAPSPTGYLHIGGARTAYFNWLYAKRHGGKFYLRIEDTDRARSTDDAVHKILESMEWLGLNWDGDPISQFANKNRHREVALQLVKEGKAYRCYTSPEELDAMRATQKEKGLPLKYDGRWRDRDESDAPEGIDPVIRLKVEQTGETIIQDAVQGEVTVSHTQLDDMVLLRSDGTPTYMLSVVVDDHDMGVTHVIRGDDHFTNTFRQNQIYKAMGWAPPQFSHIPLIHGADGAKLSKRHGALGAEAYKEMGYLPEAMCNYLLRLGWSHGDDEIITREQAIEWFTVNNIGKSPARFDLDKLNFVNSHYIAQCDDVRLLQLAMPFLEKASEEALTDEAVAKFTKALPLLKERAKTLPDLADGSQFFMTSKPIEISEKAAKHIHDESIALLAEIVKHFEELSEWSHGSVETLIRSFCHDKDIKMGKLLPAIRAATTGIMESPPLFPVLEILGQEIVVNRIKAITA